MKILIIVTILSFIFIYAYASTVDTINKPTRLSQALRQVRGFRPTLLSTARGFGKRTLNMANNVYDYM